MANWIDNMIAFFSPKRGAERLAWRNSLEAMRSYDAGNNDRLNQNWRVFNDSAEMTDRYQRDLVRARARDLERNSDILNSVVRAYKRNVIGSGFTLQAGTPSGKLNSEIEHLWRKWCKARNCDVTGTQSFNQMLKMAVTRKAIDGGILFVKRYTRDGMLPFKIQMVEVDELDTMISGVGAVNGGNRIVGGIEYNAYNKAVAYWIRQYDIDGFTAVKPVRVKADDVIFCYSKNRPSQIREISDMSPTVSRVRDINEFITAVSVKQRIEACLAVFIKKANPDAGAIGRQGTTKAANKHSYDGKMLTPGMISEMGPGDEVQVVNPTGQSADATNFTKLQQHLIAAGQGLSYEATSRDMSETNYASARQGMIEDGLTYQDEIEWVLGVMDEIYETFVISLVLSGQVEIPRFWEQKEKYLDHKWIKTPKPWIDPSKEATATKIAMNTAQKTFQQVCAENGRDWKQVIDEMAEAKKYAEKKGIDLMDIVYDGKMKEASNEKEGQGGSTPPDNVAEEGDTGAGSETGEEL